MQCKQRTKSLRPAVRPCLCGSIVWRRRKVNVMAMRTDSGWPQAGQAIVLPSCDLHRPPPQGPYAVTLMNLPVHKMEGVTPATPDVLSAFQHRPAAKTPSSSLARPSGCLGTFMPFHEPVPPSPPHAGLARRR